MSLLLLFAGVARPTHLDITDTDILQLPVDAVLAGQQPIIDRYREFDIRPRNERQQVRSRTAGARRLDGDPPSFTTTSNKKGYE